MGITDDDGDACRRKQLCYDLRDPRTGARHERNPTGQTGGIW
jgi:hypothetical protein